MASSQPIGTENPANLTGGTVEGLPFLVTHWLANFEGGETNNLDDSNNNEERRRAVERINNASAEIAAAFSSLGAYGITRPVSLVACYFMYIRIGWIPHVSLTVSHFSLCVCVRACVRAFL